MKILLPESIADITLEQFQKYSLLVDRELEPFEFNKRKVSIFTGLKYHDLDHVSNKDFEEMIEQIDTALNQDAPFVNRFRLKDIEFGFIPNFDSISIGEYGDFALYPTNEIENYNKLMAILFRPITKVDNFDNYTIETYNGTKEYSELLKQMPMSVVNGALVFFCNLSNGLQKSILKSTEEAPKREKKHTNTLKNGDGMQQ